MKLVLIGARKDGQAQLVLDLLSINGSHEVVAFLDETPLLWNTMVHNIPVLGPPAAIDKAVAIGATAGLVSIGSGAARERLGAPIVAAGLELVTLVHPRAYVAPSATLGRGVFVGPMAVVGTGAVIEDSVLVGPTAFVSHHVRIGACSSVSGHASVGGRSRVGCRAVLGLGAIILPGITVGDDAVVGAGSVVTHDVSPGATVAGVPARVLKR